MGFAVTPRGPIVVVTLDCALGGDAGVIEIGTDPPPDFPATPPHWVHLPAGIALPSDEGRESELGTAWRKWSRPHPRWRTDAPPLRQWLAHMRSLLLLAEDRRA